MHQRVFLLLPLFLCLLLAQRASAAPLDEAEQLLQRKQYAEAAAKLTDAAVSAAPDAGYAHYLRAVARAESKQHAAALTDCDAVPAGHPWQRKAVFLKAQCLAELKRHHEAEAIYSAEAARLFATTRKDKLAGALVALAQDIVKPAAPGQSVSAEAQGKALKLYRKALELETGTEVRENLLFQSAAMVRLLGLRNELPAACDTYLREFDPDWRGLAGSVPPQSPAKQAGAHRWEVRQMLIESLLTANTLESDLARRYAEDVLALWKTKPPAAGARPDRGDIEWLICRSHAGMGLAFQAGAPQIPQARWAAEDRDKHAASLRQFLKTHASHPRAAQAAFTLIQVLAAHQKAEEAIEACRSLVERADWPAPAADEADKRTPAERLESWKQAAFFQIGALRFATRQYPQAIEQWRAYIAKHPDGSLWQQAQARIMDAEFQLCLDAVAANDRAGAARRFEAFIAAHPLDSRCAQLLFLNGQWPCADALKLVQDKPGAAEARPLFESAIAEWARLIIKHPQSEEASLALYRTGVIQAEHLDRHEDALNTFQRLTWGGWRQLAAERATMMPQRSLALRTPRVFRTHETAQVRVNVRNIEKLKVSRYTLNLEDFFRSRHRLDGAAGIGSLDIDLIQPDKTWEVPVAGYMRLKPIEQNIDVPFDGAQPGVCLVRVEGEDWQASTIVIRSDIDVIVQSAWMEALVFVQDRVKGAVVADAEVLISNGKELIGQGRTGADGVFRLRGEMIREAADLCVHVRAAGGMAIQRLDLRGMTQEITGGSGDRQEVALSRQGFIYTDKSVYRAGETVHFRGIIRDVQDGAYTVPVGREYEVSIAADGGRVLRRLRTKLGEFGTFTHSIALPATMPLGSYRIRAKALEGDESHETWIGVKDFEVEEISAVFETKPEAVFRGDRIEGTLRVRYSWGAPLADEPVHLRMPDGRLLEGKTDATGAFAFTQETTAFAPGAYVSFSATLPARRRQVRHGVSLLQAGLRLVWDRLPAPALTDEPALIRVKALDHLGKPAAASVKVTLSRVDAQTPNRVLSGLPGLLYLAASSAPVRIAEFTVETDAATGLGSSTVVLQAAALHRLHAEAVDTRGNPVSITADVQASGPEDKTRLRLFSDEAEVNEGATLKVDAHSRMAAPLALVTLAGEGIIEHRVIPLAAGHNELPVAVAAAHWPHFDVSVACLEGDKLHSARRGFAVKRPLNIEIQTPPQPVKPGDQAEITLTATDAQGKPVAAELSLSLASAAFFAQFDDTPDIEGVFHGRLRRHTSVRTGSNAGFRHRAASKVVMRDETGNVVADAGATPSHLDRELQLEQRERSVWDEHAGRPLQRLYASNDELVVQREFTYPAQFDPAQIPQLGSMSQMNTQTSLGFNGSGMISGWAVTAGGTLAAPASPTALEPRTYTGNAMVGGQQAQGAPPAVVSDEQVSKWQPFPADAQWHCPLVTGADGQVRVKVRVPAVPGVWRLTSRGCSVATQLGQAKKDVTAKQDMAVRLDMPPVLRVGDVFQPAATFFTAPAQPPGTKVTLALSSTLGAFVKPLDRQAREAPLDASGQTTLRFDPMTIPVMRQWAWFDTAVEQGGKSVSDIRNTVRVLPAEAAATTTEVSMLAASGDQAIPAHPGQFLSVAAVDSPRRLLQNMLPQAWLGEERTPQTAASRLLSQVSVFEVIDKDVVKKAVQQQIQDTVSELQITQQDGGWTWQDVRWQHDSVVTSLGVWALVEARSLGHEVEDAALKSAAAYLKKALAIIPPDEPDKAAVILHAQACVNEADFSVANRLYRDRAKLNDPALAWLAAAFQRMGRVDEARELLKILEAKPAWSGSTTTSRLSNADDTTAIILYAAAKTSPGSALANKAGDLLLRRLGSIVDTPLKGLWVAALAEHFISTRQHEVPEAENLKVKVAGVAEDWALPASLPVPQPGADGKIHVSVTYGNPQAKPILFATFSREDGMDAKAPAIKTLPAVAERRWLHEGLRHKDVPLTAESTSPVKVATHGQRLRVRLDLKAPQQPQTGYVIIDEPLPAGCLFVAGSLQADEARVEQLPGMLRLWFIPGAFAGDATISYELIALHPGTYRIPHTRVRDACSPARFNAGPAGELTILPPGKPSSDPYQINGFERLELAELLFNENAFEEARGHLEALRKDAEAMKFHERDIARMLLWIHTARADMDARQVVELFEALSERHPDIVIPFDKILKVAAAYRQMGESERAWLVYRATMESSFVSDAGVSAALEDAGDFPGSAEHQISLWMEYPDGADGLLAFFSLAQRFQELAASPAAVPLRPGAPKWTRNQLLERARDLLRQVLTLHAKDDLADDAAFSLANVFFDLKDYARVVQTAGDAAATFPKSPFLNNFHYMTALGRFWQYQFPEALAAAAPVAAGGSDDAPNARYITAQIHHAQGQFAEAVRWYEKVKDEFEDARDSIAMLQEKGVRLPFATRVKPGRPVKIELEHRNVKEAALLIYRVDLLKLQERQKDLASVGSVNLAGITPQAEIKVPLGNGLDYAWSKRALELPLKDEGAYLVICRGDSQMTSGLVLLTTLDMEVHEDNQHGAIRVQVRDTVRNAYVADADIAAYDSSGAALPQKGRTDPRGAFNAAGIQGQAIVVVKLGDSRYAIHRSAGSLMPLIAGQAFGPGGNPLLPPVPPANAPVPQRPGNDKAVGKPVGKEAYLFNVRGKLDSNSLDNRTAWSEKLKNEGKGVKAEKAFKK